MPAPNVAHSDKFSVTFSNIPGYVSKNTNTDNMNLYDLYVKDLTFPGITVDYVQSDFRNFHINHPSSKSNDNMRDLTITFKISEGMLNYYYLYKWMKGLRETQNLDREKWFRMNTIKEVNISFLDNSKRQKFRYKLSNCFITDLSSINLTNGVDEELTFTVTIIYEDFDMVDGIC